MAKKKAKKVMKRYRSAVSGKMVSKATADASPATTYGSKIKKQTVKSKRKKK